VNKQHRVGIWKANVAGEELKAKVAGEELKAKVAEHALRDLKLFASFHQSMNRDGNGISEQAYMYEAIR